MMKLLYNVQFNYLIQSRSVIDALPKTSTGKVQKNILKRYHKGFGPSVKREEGERGVREIEAYFLLLSFDESG